MGDAHGEWQMLQEQGLHQLRVGIGKYLMLVARQRVDDTVKGRPVLCLSWHILLPHIHLPKSSLQ